MTVADLLYAVAFLDPQTYVGKMPERESVPYDAETNNRPVRVVITHPEMGVYLGSFIGLGFWTLLDTAGQCCAVTFESADGARDHVSTWESNNDPDAYAYVNVDCTDYATVADLIRAGLSSMLGDMLVNLESEGTG